MSHNFQYNSVLRPYIERFVRMKQSAGLTYYSAQWKLKEMDDFFQSENIVEPIITKAIYRKWMASRELDGNVCIYGKAVLWRQFAQFLCMNGIKCEIPMPPRPAKPQAEPYVLTHEQMANIFKAIDTQLQHDRNYNNALFAMPAIFRFLYSTGVRESEVIALNKEDVMLEQSVAIIRKPKNNLERYVPIGQSLKGVLSSYISYRDKLPIKNLNDAKSPFFVKPNGTRVLNASVYDWFRKAMAAAGIPYYGNRVGPVVHSFRHTFAVHAFVQLCKQGMSLESALPLVSTCLGHKSIEATEHYVRLTREMYPELMKRLEVETNDIFPEIKSYANEKTD